MLHFLLNDRRVAAPGPAGRPALDFLRRDAGLTGVKHACREGDCGACAILLGRLRGEGVDYQVVNSCLLPLAAVAGRHVVTIEGLNGGGLTPIQRFFVDRAASQCGFCTPGFVISLTGHLLQASDWRAAECVEAVAGNICRCTGYTSIVRAIHDLVAQLRARVDPAEPRVDALVREGHLPGSFLEVADGLRELPPPAPSSAPHPDELVVAGGTDLYVQRPLEVESRPLHLIGAPPAPPIWEDGGHLYLAGSATAEDMKRSPLLAEAVGGVERAMALMGSWPIRVRATVAGNLVNASPIGDMTIVLLALDAELGLRLGTEERRLPLCDFFRGYKQLDLEPGELVSWVRFPRDRPGAQFNFEKVSKRTHLDIASVNSAMSVVADGRRIVAAALSAGGVAPVPMRLRATEAFLAGAPVGAGTAREAARLARSEVAPISDVRGSAEYKRLLLGQLILAHFNRLFGIEEGLMTEIPA